MSLDSLRRYHSAFRVALLGFGVAGALFSTAATVVRSFVRDSGVVRRGEDAITVLVRGGTQVAVDVGAVSVIAVGGAADGADIPIATARMSSGQCRFLTSDLRVKATGMGVLQSHEKWCVEFVYPSRQNARRSLPQGPFVAAVVEIVLPTTSTLKIAALQQGVGSVAVPSSVYLRWHPVSGSNEVLELRPTNGECIAPIVEAGLSVWLSGVADDQSLHAERREFTAPLAGQQAAIDVVFRRVPRFSGSVVDSSNVPVRNSSVTSVIETGVVESTGEWRGKPLVRAFGLMTDASGRFGFYMLPPNRQELRRILRITVDDRSTGGKDITSFCAMSNEVGTLQLMQPQSEPFLAAGELRAPPGTYPDDATFQMYERVGTQWRGLATRVAKSGKRFQVRGITGGDLVRLVVTARGFCSWSRQGTIAELQSCEVALEPCRQLRVRVKLDSWVRQGHLRAEIQDRGGACNVAVTAEGLRSEGLRDSEVSVRFLTADTNWPVAPAVRLGTQTFQSPAKVDEVDLTGACVYVTYTIQLPGGACVTNQRVRVHDGEGAGGTISTDSDGVVRVLTPTRVARVVLTIDGYHDEVLRPGQANPIITLRPK